MSKKNTKRKIVDSDNELELEIETKSKKLLEREENIKFVN